MIEAKSNKKILNWLESLANRTGAYDMIEAKSNKKILNWLESRGALAIKTVTTNRAGTHDIIACYKGRFISIEGKAIKGGVASELQVAKADAIVKAGGLAILAHGLPDVQKAITKWLSSDKKPMKIGFGELQKFTL